MKFLHTELLDSLKQSVTERMEQHRNRMAKGQAWDDYRMSVGAHKECEALINVINEMSEDTEDEANGDDS